MEAVKTYINSGNIIFINNKLKKSEISEKLKKAIEKDFGLKIKVLIRSAENFCEIIKNLPDSWQNNKKIKSDVLFLWEKTEQKELEKILTIKPKIDNVKFLPATILWNIDRKNATKSGLHKIVGTKFYKKVTIRNVNSVRKIYKLVEEIQEVL